MPTILALVRDRRDAAAVAMVVVRMLMVLMANGMDLLMDVS